MSLPARVQAEVQRILDGEARRLLAEELGLDTSSLDPAPLSVAPAEPAPAQRTRHPAPPVTQTWPIEDADPAAILGIRRPGLGVAAYKRLLQHDPCSYCGARPVGIYRSEIDHIHPRSCGGADRWWNYTAACGSCNVLKLNDTPLEWFLRLHNELLPLVARRLQEASEL